MEKFIKRFFEFLGDFSSNAFFRYLAYGICFSMIVTVILGSFVGVFDALDKFPYIRVQAQAYWVGIVFVSFALLFSFLGYISDLNSKEDIVTPLRKQLVGYWEVSSKTWKIEDSEVKVGNLKHYCTIAIEDIGRKLIIKFSLKGSDIFKDTTFDITTIAIAYQENPRKLVYYHEPTFILKKQIGEGPM